MKIALIGLNSNLIQVDKHETIINYLNSKLYEIGESVSLISYFDNNLEKLKNIISDGYNLLFVIGTESTIYNYNIKDNLSKIFSDKLETHDSCHMTLKKYCTRYNIPFSSTEEMEVKMPTKSIPLFGDNYSNYGFMYKFNDQYIIFLPSIYDFVKVNYNDYILPLIKDISNKDTETITLRCYGILEKDIKNLITEELRNTDMQIQILSKNLDNIVYIRYHQSSTSINDTISNICSKLNKFIYSMEDTDLYETAKNLLNLHKKTLIVAETLTLGNITKNLVLLDNRLVSKSHIFTSFNSILSTLKLDKKILESYGKYSVNTVYELDNLLLEENDGDISVFVLGDSTSDICYIAIGDLDGIHVYKNKILINDDNLIENISNTALFYLIKKLRQNDLQF